MRYVIWEMTDTLFIPDINYVNDFVLSSDAAGIVHTTDTWGINAMQVDKQIMKMLLKYAFFAFPFSGKLSFAALSAEHLNLSENGLKHRNAHNNKSTRAELNFLTLHSHWVSLKIPWRMKHQTRRLRQDIAQRSYMIKPSDAERVMLLTWYPASSSGAIRVFRWLCIFRWSGNVRWSFRRTTLVKKSRMGIFITIRKDHKGEQFSRAIFVKMLGKIRR